MASSPNPLMSMIMSGLQARTSAGGGMPGQTMPGQQAPQGMGGGDAGEQYASQVAELKGADPGMLLRQLDQLKKVLANIAVQNMQRLPNVSGKIFKIIPQFDQVIKEVQQAQNVNSAVRNPISMGAATPPQETGGGMAAGGGF